MTEKVDGWYRASNGRASFGFRVEEGEVVECAPYGRKMILGLQWDTAQMKLEQGGFEIESLREVVPIDQPSERAMRFGYLLSEIEVATERVRLGLVKDVGAELLRIQARLSEARSIFAEVSREALDKVVNKEE